MQAITRKQFLRDSVGVGAGIYLLGHWNVLPALAVAPAGTPTITRFVDPLPTAIPVLQPTVNALYPGADYYEITMQPGRWKFHSQLAATPTWGYWGTGPSAGTASPLGLGYLGPTIQATQGKPVVVKYINNLDSNHPVSAAIDWDIDGNKPISAYPVGRAVPHLHGGFTPAQFDGTPHAWFGPKGERDPYNTMYPSYGSLDPMDVTKATNAATYWYSNQQPATMLWYHDHALGITRLNVYAGLAALYFVRDGQDTGQPNNPLGLPAAPYEIPLVIQDKQFTADGSLFYPATNGQPYPDYPWQKWVPEFFGDTPIINATAYPYLNVEPRRYRFRVLNGSQARFYNLSLSYTSGTTTGRLPFFVIGMEQSLLPSPVRTSQLLLAPAERGDIIVDFAQVPVGTTLLLKNNAKVPYPGGGGTPGGPSIPNLMQIRVVAPLSSTDVTKDPAKGQLVLPRLAGSLLGAVQTATTRQIVIHEWEYETTDQPLYARLNARPFEDPSEENPTLGSTEVWQFVNTTGDAHPMHIHLVRFQVVNRQPFNADQFWTDYNQWGDGGRVGPAPDVNGTSSVGAPYLTGPAVAPAPEESGWKDTAKAYPGEVLRVVATYDLPTPSPGIQGSATRLPAEYVYHCHILEHEENDMMRPFRVTS